MSVFLYEVAIPDKFLSFCSHGRNDIPGALTIILDNAPYGPNVDDAKVLFHC